ncbi:SNF2 family helicase [Cordyceps militaris]|uniref:SNF2 family helicase n=1 Tax=Cordyceps militaris TaxID=73501 RepID=A0A2H4S572_CORMI|nr:SNF2 family helicase [Cordyceps militaris]
MSPPSAHYIPVGCLGVPRSEIKLEESLWQMDDTTWKACVRPKKQSAGRTLDDASQNAVVVSALQDAFLNPTTMQICSYLFRDNLAEFEYRVLPQFDYMVVVRVYLLADDALRGSINRSQFNLCKLRGYILEALDCTARAWSGEEAPHAGLKSPIEKNTMGETESSLLKLFNDIPSPVPDPSIISDPFLKNVATNVLQGNIPGLKSDLLPHQRRSTALMIQKEVCPGTVLDPRLSQLLDRNGRSWYLDPVARSIFRDAKYYDGVSGGILAEEMGTGKTIMCLALLLATRGFPTEAPEVYWRPAVPVRKSVGSLMDMAAACATRTSQPWMNYFGSTTKKDYHGTAIAKAFRQNPDFYIRPNALPRRRSWGETTGEIDPGGKKIYLSNTSLVIVPDNLLSQWEQEIEKHTEGLEVLVLTKTDRIPDVTTLLGYDILLFSLSRFQSIARDGDTSVTPLTKIHFKRCIVDEGHVLGNSKVSQKSCLLEGVDALHLTSRWIVTGTPSRGLYGLYDLPDLYGTNRQVSDDNAASSVSVPRGQRNRQSLLDQSSTELERKDVERLGAIAALYLKARPWANSASETEDTLARWTKYLYPAKNGPDGAGRWNCLKLTINSLIVRHQLHEVVDQLPPVDAKIVLLDGSFQDMLSLNIFAMMIIFNAVQSQRTDEDYFFHPRQRKSLLQIVQNLKQSSFFGGSFFNAEEIETAVKTAEDFLVKKEVKTSAEDEALLKTAIDFGHLVLTNKLRSLSYQFHEMPVCVTGFPGAAGKHWSLDGEENDQVCTSARMMLALQKLLYKAASHPQQLNYLLNGGLVQEGMLEREKARAEAASTGATSKKRNTPEILAGNTKLGDDSPKKSRSHGITGADPAPVLTDQAFSAALAKTELVSTVSAKLSYLIDGIVKYQKDEKIIIFYENENVAWYLASILDMLRVKHLIYARGLEVKKRAQYIRMFDDDETFRVLLMDLSQAAYGLDMHVASRVYFINPVLDPQVESQAIARARRIGQHRRVSVETLVLRHSIDEVILDRKQHMTQAEHSSAKTILDVTLINNWIQNAKIVPVGDAGHGHAGQMVSLATPLLVFGKGSGRLASPDAVPCRQQTPVTPAAGPPQAATPPPSGQKRERADSDATRVAIMVSRPAQRVRFIDDSPFN